MGGVLPLLLRLVAWAFLPESAQWLATRSARREGLAAGRPDTGKSGLSADNLGSEAEPRGGQPRAWALSFGRSVIANTLLLWAFCFFVGCVVRIVSAWLPSLLVESGFSVTSAANVLAVSNLACTAGMAIVGWLIDRCGARAVLAPAAFACAICAAALGAFSSPLAIYLLASAVGFLMGMTASGSYALPAVIYSTEIRSSGIGFGAGASRLGTTLAPLAVGFLLAAAIPIDWIYYLLAALVVAAATAIIFLRVPAAAERLT